MERAYLRSDLFDDSEEILKALHHFRYRKHEVLVFHVMAQEELTFPFDQMSLFRDMELPRMHQQVDPRAIRAEYLELVREHVHRIETGCGQMDVDYVAISTARDFETALSQYLAQRMGRAR